VATIVCAPPVFNTGETPCRALRVCLSVCRTRYKPCLDSIRAWHVSGTCGTYRASTHSPHALSICPTVASRLAVSRKKSVPSVCSQEVTACVMSASVANRFPASLLPWESKQMEITECGVGTAGRVVHNLPAIAPSPVTRFANTGPSFSRKKMHTVLLCNPGCRPGPGLQSPSGGKMDILSESNWFPELTNF
jgi:hypothetical protein